MPLPQTTIDNIIATLESMNVEMTNIIIARDNVLAILKVHESFSSTPELNAALVAEKADATTAAQALVALLV